MPKFCPTCGNPLQFENAEICPSCGVRIELPAPVVPTDIRNPWIAVILSFFFPGWGQWYNGRNWDGLKFFGAFLGSYLFMFVLAVIMASQPIAAIFVLVLFVVILGIWIYGIYEAYTTAEQINRKDLDFNGKSGLFWLPVAFIVLGILMILAAVVAAFVFGMAGSSTAPVHTTEISRLPAPVYTTVATLAPPVQVISRPAVLGWNRYTIPQTQVGIYTPEDWTTTTKSMSYGGKDYTILAAYSPDGTTGIGAFSLDVTGIIGGQASLEKILDQGYIDSGMYQGFITGLTSGSSSSPVTNVIQDPTYYSISGHPARKVEYTQANTHFVDYAIVVDKRSMVLEMLMTTSQATYDDRTKGEESLNSLTG
jgi:hypothetical protein